MLIIAGLIDLIGFLLLCFALDDFGILDIAGAIIIGGLMYATKGEANLGKKTKKSPTKSLAKKALKKALTRLGLSFIIEIIPILGALAPSWTIATFLHLKD